MSRGPTTRSGKLATPSARRSDLEAAHHHAVVARLARPVMPRVKRCGSRMFERAEKLFEWPLCGVADRNSRCSNRSATSRTARVNWLSVA